jgi:hypothetical protein
MVGLTLQGFRSDQAAARITSAAFVKARHA